MRYLTHEMKLTNEWYSVTSERLVDYRISPSAMRMIDPGFSELKLNQKTLKFLEKNWFNLEPRLHFLGKKAICWADAEIIDIERNILDIVTEKRAKEFIFAAFSVTYGKVRLTYHLASKKGRFFDIIFEAGRGGIDNFEISVFAPCSCKGYCPSYTATLTDHDGKVETVIKEKNGYDSVQYLKLTKNADNEICAEVFEFKDIL